MVRIRSRELSKKTGLRAVTIRDWRRRGYGIPIGEVDEKWVDVLLAVKRMREDGYYLRTAFKKAREDIGL